MEGGPKPDPRPKFNPPSHADGWALAAPGPRWVGVLGGEMAVALGVEDYAAIPEIIGRTRAAAARLGAGVGLAFQRSRFDRRAYF